MIKKFYKGDYNQNHCEVWTVDDIDFEDYFGDVGTDYADKFVDLLNQLNEENNQLKKELKIYRRIANCGNCMYHNYDWDVDDGYGGEEYEVCDKGNDMSDRICVDWEEL